MQMRVQLFLCFVLAVGMSVQVNTVPGVQAPISAYADAEPGPADAGSRGEGECPGEGDCCEANGTPGCIDPECCSLVCGTSDFCCIVQWDEGCAEAAADICDLCGAGLCDTPALCDGDVNGDGVVDPLDTGYVLARYGGDLCGGAGCEADANCDGLIDPLDAGYVMSRFGTCNPVSACDNPCIPENDNCLHALALEDGLTPFSTINATTDGPFPPYECQCGFQCGNEKDVWYDYTATCTGYALVGTCNDDDPETGEADFDTFLYAYEGCDCPPDNDNLVGCNDDGPGCDGFTSIMEFPAIEGVCYKVRVTGFFVFSGSGVLGVSCED